MKALPEDIAKTSQPQTWHVPRKEQVRGTAVQDIEVHGYSKITPLSERVPRAVKSTLYNPIREPGVEWTENFDQLKAADKHLLVLPAIDLSHIPSVSSNRHVYNYVFA